MLVQFSNSKGPRSCANLGPSTEATWAAAHLPSVEREMLSEELTSTEKDEVNVVKVEKKPRFQVKSFLMPCPELTT